MSARLPACPPQILPTLIELVPGFASDLMLYNVGLQYSLTEVVVPEAEEDSSSAAASSTDGADSAGEGVGDDSSGSESSDSESSGGSESARGSDSSGGETSSSSDGGGSSRGRYVGELQALARWREQRETQLPRAVWMDTPVRVSE